MPNYCDNTLDITCPIEAFNKLQPLLFAKATERDAANYPSVNKELMFFSFTALLPTPPDGDWYHWNIANWGTKWDADVYHIESNLLDEPNPSSVNLKVCFSTAWSPPTNWFDSLCDILKDDEVSMEIRYSESGMGFAGTHYFNSGDRWDAEGRIYMVQDSTDIEVTYCKKTDGWRNDKGQFVALDDIREEYEYDSQY